MLRSLFVTLDFPPAHGGVARYYTHVLAQLPPHDVVVLAPPASSSADWDRQQRYRIVRKPLVNSKLWPRWLPLLWLMARMTKRERVQLIHVGQLLPVGTAALFLKQWKGILYIVYTHGFDVALPKPTPWKRWLRNTVLRHAAFVVTNSHFTERLLLSCGVAQDRIVLAVPGCSLGGSVQPEAIAAIREHHHAAGHRTVLTVCRLVERKGVDIVIKAIDIVKKTIPNVQFLVVGDGPVRSQLEQLVADRGLQPWVVFAGNVPDSALPGYYALAELFVLTPREALAGRDIEGFGIVYLEAGAFGKPVIGSSTGGVAEAVHDGVTGMLVAPNDVAATAEAITRLLSDPPLAARLGSAGQQYVREHGQWHQRVQPLLRRLDSFRAD